MQDVHGGDIEGWAARAGCRPGELLDASICLNPAGPPDWALAAARASLDGVDRYPPARADALRERIAAWHEVPPGAVLVADGTTSLIWRLAAAVAGRPVAIVEPAFSEYERAAAAHGCPITRLPASAVERPLPADHALGFVCNPSSPEASALTRAPVGAGWVIDEAYRALGAGAGRPRSLGGRAAVERGLLVLTSVTKLLAAPALRVGYLIGHPERVAALERALPPWRVGGPALAFALAAFEDGPRLRAYVDRSRALIAEQHQRLTELLRGLPGVEVLPGDVVVPWVLARLDPARGSVAALQRRLAIEQRVLIRDASTMPGVDGRPLFRVGLVPPAALARLERALRAALPDDAAPLEASGEAPPVVQ